MASKCRKTALLLSRNISHKGHSYGYDSYGNAYGDMYGNQYGGNNGFSNGQNSAFGDYSEVNERNGLSLTLIIHEMSAWTSGHPVI